MPPHIHIVGVPFNGDGTTPETENPALALREAGLATALSRAGFRVTDAGDLDMPPFEGARDPETGVLHRAAWRAVTGTIAGVLANLPGDRLLLLLGGDCSILTGIFATPRADLAAAGLVYLDGHADYRWPEDSPTGEPADLVLTALTGGTPELERDFGGKAPLVRPDRIVLLGYRDPDRIEESGIERFDVAGIRSDGIEATVERSLRLLAGRPLWLHFDVDVLDPTVMSGVIFPVRDGLSVAEAETLLSLFIATGRVLGIDIACYHPRLDPGGAGAHLVTGLVAAALGRARLRAGSSKPARSR